ncbi:hypothetical protein ABMA27_014259 [Loxostege sticticalis]|uniref:Hemocytin n=1 Tax=Loxostege sticticalis TaxID=481309 RepID=A0ABR3IDA8_LOXSC
MRLVLHTLVLFCGLSLCNGGYGEFPDAQSDVEAPPYVPAYLRNKNFKSGYTKTGYSGTKTGYSGTKTGYAGTKTGYAGTKTGYAGTKTGYAGTKNGYSPYGEKRTWDTSYGHGPSYQDFHNSASQPYMAKCVPECKNNGICVATNTCQCPPNYRGNYCEFEKKPCLVYPPLPMNSHRNCSSDFCTIKCMDGHKFIDGSTVANMRCNEGQWQPTRADFTTIPDCQPECSPPCENGGVCLALNTCQCAEDFRGPQCQYAANVCDVRKLAFNGGYSCFGDGEKFSCKLNCPSGSSYSTPRAELYTCLYSTGVYQPQPIPHCVFNDVFVVTPTNYTSHYETWSSSSHSSGSSGGGHSGGSYGPGHGSSSFDHGSSAFDHGSSTFGQGSFGSGGSATHMVVQDLTPKGGTCLTWAGEHYKTFDGKIYSFKSQCQHILVRDAQEHKYTVAVKAGNCPTRAYCPSEITIYIEEKAYTLSVHPEDGSVSFRSTKRLIPIPASLPGIRVAMPADYVIVNLDGGGLALKWDTNDVILVEGSVLLWNNTEGLCGTLNSNPEDDLVTREGTRAKTKAAMASSWQLNKIGDICESNPTEVQSCASQPEETKKKAQQFCARIFSKEKFRKCSKVMDVTLLLEACQEDYCACKESQDPEECACSTVSVFAKECLRHGVEEMKYWRDPDTCPKTCPDGKIYKVCGPDAQPSCAFPALSTKVDNATCIEGCFCPEGLLLEGGKCIQKEECPCRLRNRNFKPGSVIPKECNTCTCQAGEWKCTQVACGARCSAVGDPHYTTFDGQRYDFMGHCTYTLLQTDNVTVEVENVACAGSISEEMNLTPFKGEGKPSCTKAVNLKYDGAQIHLKQGGLILVNGKEVSALPVNVGKIRIRAASSLFVIVQLPLKVDIWWDGNTRVFVDVPPSFQDKTKGLCGTFNLKQNDDFLTPEGDVEQSTLAFANKWKTREFCADLDTKEPDHPCKANVENKEAAEKYCSKLKSKLFEECHWYVDVEPYYESCLYDMCACAGDVSRCLCPIIGDYAMSCAKSGVKVQWRYNVKECELQCTGGQEYTVCADSCERTCTDIALAATSHCKPCCVEGCACPPGQVLDDNNSCVPKGLCPCNHKGMKFDAGYKEVRPGRRERELCTCVGARWECVPASDADIQNYPPAEDLRSSCSATDHKEFTTCMIAEPLTCKNMHLPPSTTSAECRPGCQCKAGYVMDTSSKKCVLKSECPCHHGGRSYPDGHVMKEECNQCECKSGNWSCTTRTCSGICGAWGDSHLNTFDGTEYDFEGVCTYLLAKGVMDSNDGFDVEIQNVPCGTTGATCSKSTTLKVGGGGNQEIVSLTKDAPLPDTSKLKRIKLRVAGAFVFLDVPSLGVSLQWDRGLRVYVKVDSVWRNRVKGLCGNFNGDQRDDFQTPSGGGLPESSALVFADSWKLKPTCPKPKEISDYCKARPERKDWAVSTCGAMKRYPFSLCATEVPPAPYMLRCEKDACACDSGADCDCACAALAAYAYACALRGVTFNWRSQLMCPMQCDEECSNYDGCMSACPLETCDNTKDYKETMGDCSQDTCVEGCKPKKPCPEGQVYSNNSLTECVPRAKCRPVCMTLPDGRELFEGDIIEQDKCHTCRCSKEERVCTGQPCSTAAEPYTELTSPKPHDEPLKCVDGWTAWVSKHTPEATASGESVETEPLPELKDLKIGTPMCSKEMMTNIECRTRVNHESPKQTGLNVECSLERGLVCKELGHTCPDFEIRVLCECEPFQCLNATHPNYQHPTDCEKFYECTPDMLNPSKHHAVLKSCAPGTLYNPVAMICDWPDAVKAVRPECGPTTVETTPTTTKITTVAPTSPTTLTTPTTTEQASTAGLCPPGQVYRECAYPCDQLCDYFGATLREKGQCGPRDTCIQGCVDISVAEQKCGKGYRWRDLKTCVPEKDCTCYADGQIIKPGGRVVDGCVKCQCLNNAFHCDSSECTTLGTTEYEEPRNLPIKSTHTPTTTMPKTTTPKTTTVTEPATKTTLPPTTVTPLIVMSTQSPPPECEPDAYKYLLWADNVEVKPVLTASSVISNQFQPQDAVLNGRPKAVSAGSWNPQFNDKNQYIQVEFPYPEAIYGVVMQGSPLFDQFVTSYEIMYGDDGQAFSLVSEPDGSPKIFRGPVDHKTALKQMISPPIEAKFVRVKPLTWHEEIAVRLELIGCGEPRSTTPEEISTTQEPMQCTEPLGLAADLPIESIEVSSNNDARKYFALDGPRGWRPLYSTPGEWIMFDFTSPRNLTGITTKGGPKGWVTAYHVMYTTDLTTFNPVVDSSGDIKKFPGNFDEDTPVLNQFRLPIHARYLKVLPVMWTKGIEMRIEPIGCFEPYPIPITTPVFEVQGTTVSCNVCPGVPATVCACARPGDYYNGEECVPRDLCPCVSTYLTYDVGASFRGDNCDECVCKLGGVTDCKPVKECKCAPNLVPKLVPKPSCECLCEPCPEGTRICPTSKLCLPLDKWCDGLQDCPDDEKDCATTPATTSTTPRPSTLEPTVVTTVQPTVGVTAGTKAPVTTTPKPIVCPIVQCPPGYIVRFTSPSSYSRAYTSDIPPPRPRYSYQRYQRGGYAKGGFSKGGYSKGGYSKGGFSKGGYNPPLPPSQPNQAFTLDKPTLNPAQDVKKQECQQFKCIPQLPPPPRPGSTLPPLICSAPVCPPRYSLRLDSVPVGLHECPQYSCVPPPERPSFCNVTERAVSTFDGADYKYDLCFHILARDTRLGAWSVLVRKKCRLDGCQNELIVHQDDQLIKVKPNLMVEYDNYEYTVEQTTKICFQKNSFDVAKLGDGLMIKSRRYNFTVMYNSDGDIKIGVSKKYMGTVDGLCGAFDGSLHNERRLPDGSLAVNSEQMARAWGRPGLPRDACKTKLIDEQKQKRVWELCDVITQEPLAKCGKVLSLDKWRNICLEKICKCTDLIVNGTKRTEEECRCLLVEKLVAECLAADKDIDITEWRTKLNCPAECPPPLVHFDCYRKRCEPTCSDLGSVSQDCPMEDGQCFPGCYCPPGTYRKGSQCLAPASCLDCACKGVGTPAGYTTFEGDSFPFLGNCTYLASRDRNETGQHKYEIYATNGPCEDNANVTCTKTIHVIYEKIVIHINRDPANKKLMTTIGNEAVFKYPVKKDWVTISQLNGQDVMVLLTDAHVEVTVLLSKMELSVRVPTYLYSNRTEGLCGVCAGSHEHLITANGTSTDDLEEYGKSWQASPAALTALDIPPEQQQCDQPPPPPPCTPPPPEENPCYNLYNPEVFGACHALVDPQSYVESCVEEQCSMNSSDVCSTLSSYAAACRQQGVCLEWRARSPLCPYPCEEPLVYRPCVDCERTCDNNDELKSHPEKCTSQPVEGCFCPEGKVRVNNTCIEPTKCFPCDADKEHYAGDEWQENACKKCTCSKLSGENTAHVSCTTQTCTTPVCSQDENMIAKPKRADACCDEYMCVPKPKAQCEEPKKMECGFGQVLKQKTTANGCKEFACECKPASECEHIPTDQEVDFLEPGLERVIDNSGCCPRVNMICRKEACPKKPDCPKFQNLVVVNVTGKCCQKYECELPKDKCVVKLEWEAAPRGGEKARATPEEVLKDIDEAWLDGPCRWCRCESTTLGASARCSISECPAAVGSEQFVVEPRPVPFACCPALVQVACRDGESIYRVGENWTSPTDVCETYQCSEASEGKLEKVTTVKSCDTACQPGWKYFPAEPSSKQCCGKCKPVACVCEGKEHPIGEKWTSPDFCTNYTCVDLNGTLQIQSANESCPEVSEAFRKQFVLNEEAVPGKCCKKQEPVACRVGNKIYQEGQTWPSSDPCKNLTCTRDLTGRLTHSESVETCPRDCKRGWAYKEPPTGVCCGHCVQEKCIIDDELVEPGTTWQSDDNCTTYSCEKSGDDILVTSARETCPDVSSCSPEDLVNETCCQVCKEKPMAQSTCAPALLSGPASVGAVRAELRPHGACRNDRPLVGFYECRGACDSGTLYNNVTGIHDSKCECCQAVAYGSVDVWLACADGSRQKHRVASPSKCACMACQGGNVSTWPGSGGKPVKGGVKGGGYTESLDYDIPEIYQRMRVPDRR